MNGKIKEKSVPLTLMSMQKLAGDRFKVKIKENDLSLATFKHNGEDYEVLRRLGRGRYIMRKTE